MTWNEPAASVRAENMLLPALASLGLAVFALCLPPVAFVSVGLAWWCWRKCGQDAAVRGFGFTLAALVVSHAMLLVWLVLLAIVLDGSRGITLASLTVLAYVVICLAVTRPSAWKYALATFCFSAVAASLAFNAIYAARYDAQNNFVLNNLRQLGIDRHWAERQRSETTENEAGGSWTPPIFRNIYEEQRPLPMGEETSDEMRFSEALNQESP